MYFQRCPSGIRTIITGNGGTTGSIDGFGTGVQFNNPYGIVLTGGNAYVADTYNFAIRRVVISTGQSSTLIGKAGQSGTADGCGSNALLGYVFSIAFAGGFIYAIDSTYSNLRKVDPSTGCSTTVVGNGAGYVDGPLTSAKFWNPVAIASDTGGNLLVSDEIHSALRKVTFAAGMVTTFAGLYSGISFPEKGSNVNMFYPQGVALDTLGNVYVAPTYFFALPKVSSAGGWLLFISIFILLTTLQAP